MVQQYARISTSTNLHLGKKIAFDLCARNKPVLLPTNVFLEDVEQMEKFNRRLPIIVQEINY